MVEGGGGGFYIVILLYFRWLEFKHNYVKLAVSDLVIL